MARYDLTPAQAWISNDGDALGARPAAETLALLAHSQAGRAVWLDHGIDVLNAIDVASLLVQSPEHEKLALEGARGAAHPAGRANCRGRAGSAQSRPCR